MKKLIMTSVVMAIMATVPMLSFAATYQYVDTNGSLSAVDANSPTQALTVSNIAPTSGVMLVSDSLSFTSFVPAGTNTYQYVDTNGNVSAVNADSPTQALTVSNIAPTSGVMLITGTNGI